ncbi:MAG TPA: CDP-alcohol phosphatidyltransferase family protein [Polyangia bacterium]|nr:CDP-alcohol phosphatidyltransferase family protein [Polyangia bacterium]
MSGVRDIHLALAAWGLIGLLVVAYVVRSLVRGRARHARIDKDGGSVLLGKSIMEMAYWGIDPLVDMLVAMRLTPTQVTALSLVPAALAGVAIALGWFALAGVLAAASAVGDILDGLLARRLGVASDAGEAFDAAADRYGEFFFFAGLAVYYRDNVKCLLLVMAAFFGSFMVSYTTAKAEAMKVEPPRGAMRRPERAVYLFAGAALTAVTKALWGDSISLVLREFPIIFALALVAAVTNISTVKRLGIIIEQLRVRGPAPVVPPPAPVEEAKTPGVP